MRLVFWQNCLSPHQLPYIVKLIDDPRIDCVVIAAGEALSQARREMGWNIENLQGIERCEVYVNPVSEKIEELLTCRQSDSWHLFSGISGFPFVFDALKRSLKYNLKRGNISERPNTFAFGRANGKPLWLHKVRFLIKERKYAKHMNAIFAIGEEAVAFFRSVYSGWNVYPFAYCTLGGGKLRKNEDNKVSPKFVFIGSLSWRKSPISILEAYCVMKQGHMMDSFNDIQLYFIGEGDERKKLDQFTSEHELENVFFLGTQNNSDIPNILNGMDVLILPSIYDGWGAVVNEAITQGLYVLCSDRCGAKVLLKDDFCGKVFESGNTHQLAYFMSECVDRIDEIRKNRNERQIWASEHICGGVISKYMVDCLLEGRGHEPWISIK